MRRGSKVVHALRIAAAAGKKKLWAGGRGPYLAFAVQGEYTDFSL
jgi:hypothetical protein